MACSFYASALLLGNTSIRVDRTASTALTNTSTASCLLLFTHIKLIKELFQVTMMCRRQQCDNTHRKVM